MNEDTAKSKIHVQARSGGDGTIVLACRNTDATNALIREVVKSPGLPLRIIENNNVVAMFAGMLKGEYDVSEMSLAEFIYYRSRGAADFIGIPVFPSRVFRQPGCRLIARTSQRKEHWISPLGANRVCLGPRHFD